MKLVRKHPRLAPGAATRLTRRVRFVFLGALFLTIAMAALYLVSPRPAEAVSNSIVISQIYGGGGTLSTSGTYKCDYIELYNLGTAAVDLSTWSIQYDSAASTSGSFAKTNLTGSLAPGRYYLIKESCSATNPAGLDLPAPSATGSINLAATAGKVALVNNQTALPTSASGCPTGSIIDFVGYGTANCREGTTAADNAPAASSTTADIRKNGGNLDTDNNAADFTAAAPFPRSGVFNASSSIIPDSSSHACRFYSLDTAPTLSWSHTIGGGSNRLLIVGISTSTTTADPAARVVSVTLTNGASVTPLARVDDTLARDSTNKTEVEMFRLLQSQMPPAGTYTITAALTVPGATSTYAVGGSVSFSGVDQTTPFNTGQTSSALNTFARATGNSTSPSVTVTSGSNEYVLDTVSSVFTGSGSALLSANNPLQTERWNGGKSDCFGTGVIDSIGAGSTRPGASPSLLMQWSLNSAQPWAIGAVSIRPASTLVELSSFEAEEWKSGVALRWRTGYEVNNLGFNLYREQRGKRVQVNPSLIAGSSFLVGQGGALTAGDSYSWFDPQGTSDSVYYLEDVDLSGTSKLNGPVTPTVHASSSMNGERRQALLLSEFNAQAAEAYDPSKWQKGWPAFTGTSRELLYKVSSKPAELQRSIASQGAIKLSVNREGWYRVTQSDLVAAGFSANVDASMLQLYSGGVQVPILVNAAAQQFSTGDSFEFYGSGLDTPTTETNIYWLIVGQSKGLRIERQPRPTTSAEVKATAFALSRSQLGGVLPIQDTQLLAGNLARVSPQTAPEKSDSANASVTASQSPRRRKRARRLRRRSTLHSHAMLLSQRPVGAQSYPYTVELKERLIYISSLINGETENFYGKVIGSSPASEQMVLDNVDKNYGGTAQLEIALQGYTLVDHQVRVKVNDLEVGTLSFTGQEHPLAQFTFPQAALREGENALTLERRGRETDFSVVDYVRLTYRHSYRADRDALHLTARGTTRVDGFTSSKIRVIDISDPLRIREMACTVETSSSGYAVNFQAPREGEYMAFTDDRISLPSGIVRDKPSQLKSGDNGADFIIISNGDFIGSVQPLAELRRREGLAVSVIDVEDIYDEFSYGAHSPYAIREFLSWARTHWRQAPESVLLVGDASIDPKNYLGGGPTDFVPTKLVDASTMETASDDWLADFNQDGVAEMAVGRLPVRTKAEADEVVSKITGYSSGNALPQVLMVVDKNQGDDNFSFAEMGAAAGSLLPSSISLNTISRAAGTDDTTLHSQIIDAINQGPLVVNYIGHGSVEVWTGAPILSTTDMGSLTNANRLPVFVMMTCLNGYFPNPARESLAEALLRSKTGGAVAVWASSGMTEPNAQSQMNKRFYQLVFGADNMTLGEAVKKAKEIDDPDVRRTWIFFGDPTMRIR